MKVNELAVQRLETERDVEQYLELVRTVFGEKSEVDKLARKLVDYHKPMTLKDFFVIKHQGRMVSTLNLIPVAWDLGGIRLKVAEMGHVATLPEYRRRGLIRMLVEEFHREAEVRQYDLTVIEGIPYFYRQFGYEYAIPLLEETVFGLRQPCKCPPNITIHSFTDKDLPEAMRLLERSQKKFYVHSIRDEVIWQTQQRTCIASDPEPFQSFAVEEEGKLTAYFRIRENRVERLLVLTEITDVDRTTARAILNFLEDYGKQNGLERLSANVSYQEPFADYLFGLGGVKRSHPYAWQVRIIDYLKLFRRLKPLFESRLSGSAFHRLTEVMNFNFRLFTIRLNVRDGKIEDIRKIVPSERSPLGLTPSAFVQLVLGYRSREELESVFPDVRIDASYRTLIDILFPKFPSYIHSAY